MPVGVQVRLRLHEGVAGAGVHAPVREDRLACLEQAGDQGEISLVAAWQEEALPKAEIFGIGALGLLGYLAASAGEPGGRRRGRLHGKALGHFPAPRRVCGQAQVIVGEKAEERPAFQLDHGPLAQLAHEDGPAAKAPLLGLAHSGLEGFLQRHRHCLALRHCQRSLKCASIRSWLKRPP